MAETTPLEALVAEMLGDIGKLHDTIKSLPEALKGSLAPSLGALVLASKEAQEIIEKLGAAEKVSFSNFTAAEKNALRDSLRAALRAEVSEALSSAAGELAASARIHQNAANQEAAQRWQWIAVALAVGLLGGALGFYGSHLLYGQQHDEQAAFGRAVGTVWDSLDTKTKERIQAARNHQ